MLSRAVHHCSASRRAAVMSSGCRYPFGRVGGRFGEDNAYVYETLLNLTEEEVRRYENADVIERELSLSQIERPGWLAAGPAHEQDER